MIRVCARAREHVHVPRDERFRSRSETIREITINYYRCLSMETSIPVIRFLPMKFLFELIISFNHLILI